MANKTVQLCPKFAVVSNRKYKVLITGEITHLEGAVL